MVDSPAALEQAARIVNRDGSAYYCYYYQVLVVVSSTKGGTSTYSL